MRAGAPVLLLAAALPAYPASAAPQAPDPHSREMEALAQEALSRARILPISGRVQAIVGLTSATTGRVEAIRDLAAELRSAGLAVTTTEAGLRVAIPENVLFEFDSASLRPDAAARLRVVAAGAQKVADLPVRIEGHTDSKGGDAYNQRLSEARAAAVRAWLQEAGVAPARLSAQGLGARRPVAPNTTPDGRDDPAGRQRNRRVEIVIGA